MTTSNKKVESKEYPLLLVKCVFAILASLPLPVARWLGRMIATIAWTSKARVARTTLQNVAHCYPEWTPEKRESFSRESLSHTGQTFFETPIVWRGRIPRLNRWLKGVQGEEEFKHAVAEKGAIAIPLHFGNWEFLSLYLVSVAPFLGLYSAERMHNLQDYITRCRSRFGAEFTEADLTGVLKIRRHLKRKGMVVIFPDQIPDTGGIVVADLFGQPANTGTAISQLLRQTQVPAFLFATKRIRGGFEIHISQPNESIYGDDLQQSAKALNQAIEDAIQIDPSQYQWEYKRYRGQAEIYQ